MSLYLNLLSVVLLALVAGLLMAVWFQLRDWRRANREAPLLAERLAEQLLAARKGLADLKQGLTSMGPELSTTLSDGGKLRVELQFLMQRCEQVAGKLEQLGQYSATVAQAETVAEARQKDDDLHEAKVTLAEVAGQNGAASSQGTVRHEHGEGGHDPLEELLAGLQKSEAVQEENVTKLSLRRRRKGPVTQAELDLQHNINRKAG